MQTVTGSLAHWRNRAEVALILAGAAFWAWVAVISLLRLDGPGWWGYVLVFLWAIYLLGVPVLAVVVVVSALCAVILQHASRVRLIADLTMLAATIVVWRWSIFAHFDFLE